ncbi:MAG: hypothetical protein AAF125_09245 [Chloroflexota bacterium]
MSLEPIINMTVSDREGVTRMLGGPLPTHVSAHTNHLIADTVRLTRAPWERYIRIAHHLRRDPHTQTFNTEGEHL